MAIEKLKINYMVQK